MPVHRPPKHEVDRDQGVRVIGYARVNAAPPHQSRYLALQWDRMRRFALAQPGWTIIGEFSDVTARRSAGRLPGLREAIAEAVAGGCNVFLVDSFDRVSRQTCEFAAVVEELNRAGVTPWSATEPFNSGTPSGHFALQVLLAVAEYERLGSRREWAARARRGRE